MNTFLHIAPQLPPAIDGVGDYCFHLWQSWPGRDDHWSFASLRGADATTAAWPQVRVFPFQGSTASLREAIEESGARFVVLHYVGYGYHPKGVPLWLPDALEGLRNEDGSAKERRLITFFHEMYADSKAWRSPYWVKPFARRIIHRLVHASDAWITNCQCYNDWLLEEFGADPRCGGIIPVGSNVPAAPETIEARLWPFEFGRKLRVVLFGLAKTRLWALEKHGRLLASLVRAGVVESILLLGKGDRSVAYQSRLQVFQQAIGGEWHSAFDLPPVQAAEAIAACDIGLIANNAGTLTKSGVFAALATNGVIGIVADAGELPLAAPFGDCVLLNDDQPATWVALLNELRGTNRMVARRRATLRAARTYLAWPQIAAAWHDVFGRCDHHAALGLTKTAEEHVPAFSQREVGA